MEMNNCISIEEIKAELTRVLRETKAIEKRTKYNTEQDARLDFCNTFN
jgi:hypothetical protein